MTAGIARATTVLVLIVAAACDSGHSVYLHNATDRPVLVYERMGNETTPPFRVEPGQTFRDAWIVPATTEERAKSTVRRRVEATLEDGTPIFCDAYSYSQLDAMGWRIEIERRNACPQG